MDRLTRRDLLRIAGATGAVGLAGCGSSGSTDSSNDGTVSNSPTTRERETELTETEQPSTETVESTAEVIPVSGQWTEYGSDSGNGGVTNAPGLERTDQLVVASSVWEEDGLPYPLPGAAYRQQSLEYSQPGEISGEPAVLENTIYIGYSFDGASAGIHAIDGTSGERQWYFSTGADITTQTPVVTENSVFFGAQNGYLYALDRETGDERWSSRPVPVGAMTVVDGTLYFASERYASIRALDAGTGELSWERRVGRVLPSAGIAVANNRVYANPTGQPLFALSIRDGTVQWTKPLNTSRLPVARGNQIYNIDDSGTLIAFESNSGDRIWEHTADTAESSAYPPSVAENSVFYTRYSDEAVIYSLNRDTGTVQWKTVPDDPTPLNTIGVAKPTVSADIVYVPSRKAVSAFNRNSGELEYQLLSRRDLKNVSVSGNSVLITDEEGNLKIYASSKN